MDRSYDGFPQAIQPALIQPALFLPDGAVRCDVVLFDLDGTIFDTGPGIKNCIRKTIDYLGLPSKEEAELDAFIGPPLRVAFQQFFNLSDEDAEYALLTYRRFYYRAGIYDASVYPGMPELFHDLQTKGYAMSVGTSKAWVLAHRILRHYGLRAYMDAVVGCYRDGRLDSKTEVLRVILDHYAGKAPLPPGRLGRPGQTQSRLHEAAAQSAGEPRHTIRILMVGDRYYDVEGAKALGLPTIGVTFGYGTLEELREAGAALTVDHPAQISAMLPDIRR